MHDIRWIRDNSNTFRDALTARNWDSDKADETVARVLQLDDARREIIALTQHGQEQRNRLSKEIGEAMKQKDAPLAAALKARVAQLKDDMEGAAGAEKAAITALEEALLELPNLPLAQVPHGKDEHDNVELRVVGDKPKFPEGFTPKQHFEIGEAMGLMDFDAAAKMSGARFVVLKGDLARLERAIGQFMLDLHVDKHGYTEINPPILVRDEAMFGTAQLPKFRDEQFRAGEELWLIPTAEVPLTNLVRESILEETQLPMRVTALTPCFRAEAGAAGRDTRGMIRQHQFSKVELVSITTPEASLAEHERMTGCAEAVLKALGLAYRVVTLCTGDMGFASQKTHDIEVWLPGQNRYREISSCSVCGDFQARRMNARYRPAEGRYRPAEGKGARFVHTLNGSGVAVGRALIAVLENYQNPDGAVRVPQALQSYMGGRQQIGATV